MKILFHVRSDLGYGGISEDALCLFDLLAEQEKVILSSLVFEKEEKVTISSQLRGFIRPIIGRFIPIAIKKQIKKILKKRQKTLLSSCLLEKISQKRMGLWLNRFKGRIENGRLSNVRYNKCSNPRDMWMYIGDSSVDFQGWDYVFLPFFLESGQLKSNITYLLRLHDISFITHSEHFSINDAKTLEMSLCDTINRKNLIFICNSPYSKEQLEAYSDKVKGRTYVVPCQVSKYDVQKESLTDLKDNIKLSLSSRYLKKSNQKKVMRSIESMHGYILVVGATHARKNYEALLQGWKIHRQQQGEKALPLVWVGYDCPDYKGSFIDDVNPFINSGEIIHLDRVTRHTLNQLFLNASLFVVASHEEGFSIPPIEANQFKCPVIASDIAVHRWVLGEAALFFNPNDPEKLADCIMQLQFEKEAEHLRQRLISLGVDNAKRFYKENVELELTKVLESIKSNQPCTNMPLFV
ncbi:hypothetical protein COB21_05790 [Candidatus Aerophobetes bacterium]|uniref:Glycosyl transferase family 1 domain-containing protein n=1 Tax=Aerophobetes bacterium TaxID=2030807 RepID=A0A2A4WXZ9_UNCAE|nr:MAG: hypothetical protein COB21_05790 [Candidatus Aerophobetes bacterium]